MTDIGVTTATDADGVYLEDIIRYGEQLRHSTKRLTLVVHIETRYDDAYTTRGKSVTYVYYSLIKNGDIVSIDLGAALHGFNGDNAATFPAGDISQQAQRLCEVTEQSLYKGIEAALAGKRIGDIGAAVQQHCEAAGYGVVRDFVGHGVGKKLHEDPSVPNFGTAGRGARLLPGMTIAIEPMITQGDYAVKQLSDGWTIVTADGSLAAHFEHTVAITKDGPVIMTKI